MEKEVNIGKAEELPTKSREDKFKNTIAFLKAAIDEGVHWNVPQYRDNRNKWISEDQWIRQRNISGIYFGSPATLENIGRMYGITKEMVRLIKKSGVYNLWKNCSLETQILFPLQEIALGKPLSQKSKERKSHSRGGRSVLINRQLQAGKSIKEIQEENGLSSRNINASRLVLRKWGTEVPYINTPPSKNLELENKLRSAETDKEKQELLNQVKRRFYHTHVRGNDALLVSVLKVIQEARFRVRNFYRVFTLSQQAIVNGRIPMGELEQKVKVGDGEIVSKYHFILAKDKERAIKILQEDPNLQRFRRP